MKQWYLLFFLSISATQSMANVLTAGSGHSCAIQPDNKVICWGNTWASKASDEKFIDISAGRSYTCGILTDHTVSCWGSSSDGQGIPPEGVKFTQVSAALYHTCGIREDKTVACWGFNPDEDYGQSNPPDDSFVQISAGGWHTCGVKTDGMVACWGDNENPFSDRSVVGGGQATPPEGVAFTQISAGLGGWHTCGVRADNHQVQCWGLDGDGQASPAAGEFSQVSSGKYFSCGVRVDHTLACWGWSDYGQVQIPQADCLHLSDKYPHYECTTTEEDDKYIFVAAGLIHVCAVKIDNTVVCWGKNNDGRSSPPLGLVVGDSLPSIEIKVAVELNKTTYQRGQQFEFGLNVEGGEIEKQYDLYAALVFPQAYFLTIGDKSNFSDLNGIISYKNEINLSAQQTFSVLDVTIPEEVETGEYRACSVITDAGILQPENEKNWLTYACKAFTLE